MAALIVAESRTEAASGMKNMRGNFTGNYYSIALKLIIQNKSKIYIPKWIENVVMFSDQNNNFQYHIQLFILNGNSSITAFWDVQSWIQCYDIKYKFYSIYLSKTTLSSLKSLEVQLSKHDKTRIEYLSM